MTYAVLSNLKVAMYKVLKESLALLEKRGAILESKRYRFKYVNLKTDTCPGILLSLMAHVAKNYPGYLIHAPRLMHYDVHDFAEKHVDDYPGYLSVSVLIWEHGKPSLYINDELVTISIGDAVVFDSQTPHEVKPIDFFSGRLVLVFWLKKELEL